MPTPLSYPNKGKRRFIRFSEINGLSISKKFIEKGVKAEIDSYRDSEEEYKKDTTQTQDILMFDNISI